VESRNGPLNAVRRDGTFPRATLYLRPQRPSLRQPLHLTTKRDRRCTSLLPRIPLGSLGMTFDTYDADKWIEQLRNCQHLPEPDMKMLCDRVRNILLEESNIQPVSSPVTICGDIHGQFWDLLELLRKGGEVPDTSYIFMARMLSCGHWI